MATKYDHIVSNRQDSGGTYRLPGGDRELTLLPGRPEPVGEGRDRVPAAFADRLLARRFARRADAEGNSPKTDAAAFRPFADGDAEDVPAPTEPLPPAMRNPAGETLTGAPAAPVTPAPPAAPVVPVPDPAPGDAGVTPGVTAQPAPPRPRRDADASGK